uniref:DNA primase n=1 Tax=Albugo laibachii Nc14 TaxID=890382 RepID=F0VZ34_9STRA|nr:DNA primase small subunit putative [Albugo laibachii Nc14]|eukprot:CCA14049.1 DNA primase small subunit putative [Albugo laibachii Nc14]
MLLKGEEYLRRREFSFTLENGTYIRYKTFQNHQGFRNAMLKQMPCKIDIGAVFSISPADKGKVNPTEFIAEERELVFDIDLTDYDDTRTCCREASTCSRCWSFMIAAVKVLDTALRQDFGFKHILWVYSGRRGVHCWVADDKARVLTNEARTSIVHYLSLVEGNENSKRKVQLRYPLHPSLHRATEILEPLFHEIILSENGQDILNDEKEFSKLLAMVPDEEIRNTLAEKWRRSLEEAESPESKWNDLQKAVHSALGNKSHKRTYAAYSEDSERKKNLQQLKGCLQEIVCAYLYPRLDVNVSKQRNHLLKSPFAVHPKTGRICVPIDPQAIIDFNPDNAPTLALLQQELNNKSAIGSDPQSILHQTSLQKHIKFFEKKFLKPLLLAAKANEREGRESGAAFSGDW